MKLLFKWLIAAGAILLAAYLVPGITVSNFSIALFAAFFLGILSVTIKPIVKLLTLPLTLLTLGVFSLVINALFFWLTAYFVRGFDIAGFVPAFLGAIIVSIVNFFGNKLLDKDDDNE